MAYSDTEIKAMEADSLLKNELFDQAFTDLREAFIQAIEDNPVKDDQMRDKLMLSLQVLKGIRRQIESHIVTGQLENLTMEDF